MLLTPGPPRALAGPQRPPLPPPPIPAEPPASTPATTPADAAPGQSADHRALVFESQSRERPGETQSRREWTLSEAPAPDTRLNKGVPEKQHTQPQQSQRERERERKG